MFDEFEKPPDVNIASTTRFYPEAIAIGGILLAAYLNAATKLFGG